MKAVVILSFILSIFATAKGNTCFDQNVIELSSNSYSSNISLDDCHNDESESDTHNECSCLCHFYSYSSIQFAESENLNMWKRSQSTVFSKLKDKNLRNYHSKVIRPPIS